MATDTPYVRGSDKLARRIAAIRANLQLPALTEEIATLLLKRTIDRFDAEMAPNGSKWEPLDTATIQRRARGGFPGDHPILRRTGTLRDSIAVIKGGVGAVYTNTGAESRIGIQSPKIAEYARVLNAGGRGIPARRFLGVSQLDVKAVDSLMRRKAKKLEDVWQRG